MAANSSDPTQRELMLFDALAQSPSTNIVAKTVGISAGAVEAVKITARYVLAANDDVVEDFLQLIEKYDIASDHEFVFPAKDRPSEFEASLVTSGSSAREPRGGFALARDKRTALADLADNWSAADLRDLGGTLLRLADAIDQDWNPETTKSEFHWPSAAARIESNALELAKKAMFLQQQSNLREKFLPQELFGEPAWFMLLELFCQFAGGAAVSTKSLTLSAGCAETTALRYVNRLEMHGLVQRTTSQSDKRVTLVELTKKGVLAVGRLLEKL